ncbi:MAG TPA: helix-turn-helix transcriptional regulator [Thermomicrobiaceae bacterium]|nr:helix-turn-helix transcriptional regulator [Thermomicrobiaceae bacterium]
MDDGAEYREAVGQVARALRAERGWSLREASARSGVSVPYLSEIERGRKEPSGAVLAQLARAFDLPLPGFLTRVAFTLQERAERQALESEARPRERGLTGLDELDETDVAAVAEFLSFLRWRRAHAGEPTGSTSL